MLRAGKIKPSFFKNEDLAACTPEARLCLLGLRMLVDASGRLEDRPSRIRAELFPHDAVDVERLLVELERWGFICRCVVSGERLIQMNRLGFVE